MTETSLPPSAARSALLLATGGMIALAAAMGIGRFIYTPILPLMVEALGLSQGQAGLIASANFAGYLAGALAAASPGLPGSRRGWFLGALAASAATTAAMAVGGNVAVFAGLRFAGGVASAFVLVMSSTLVLERLAELGRGDLAATHFAGVGVGIAASSLLMLGLGPLAGGWRAGWLAAGLLSAAALAAAVALIPRKAEPASPSDTAARAADGPRGFRWLVAAYGLFGFGYVITATFIVALARASEETRPLEQWVWLAVGCTAAPSVALWAWLGRSLGVTQAFALACLIEAAGIAASVLWPGAAGLLLGAALLGGTFMGVTALGLIGARAMVSSEPQRALALMTAAFGAGQIVGPSFAGFVHDATASFTAPSLVAAGALAVAAGFALMAGRATA